MDDVPEPTNRAELRCHHQEGPWFLRINPTTFQWVLQAEARSVELGWGK